MEFYFQCAVIVIGVVGTASNALILYAMVASKQHNKHILIFNQNLTDLVSCIFLAITYAVKLRNFYLTGLGGYLLCTLIVSKNILWCFITASKTNLVFVTIERYLNIVHHVWSKKKLRKWMIYLAMALAWIISFIHLDVVVSLTSAVVDGVCYAYVMWESRMAQMYYEIFAFFLIYIYVLIVCYVRILVVIRRQAQVMAGYDTVRPSTSQVHSHQMQSNLVKTMILVSAFYAITDLPIKVYLLIESIRGSHTITELYYSTMFIFFFYFCANPFIYATKFEPVKDVLLRLIPCKNRAVQPMESIEIAAPATTRCGQTKTSHK